MCILIPPKLRSFLSVVVYSSDECSDFNQILGIFMSVFDVWNIRDRCHKTRTPNYCFLKISFMNYDKTFKVCIFQGHKEKI